jgi:hypothetical protein
MVAWRSGDISAGVGDSTVDVSALAGAVVPYVVALVTAYGAGVLTKIQEAAVASAAEGSVGLGRRLLLRILGREESRAALEGAVSDVAENPGDEDFQVALRAQIKKALVADQDLARDIAQMLDQGGVTVTVSGERSIAAQTISGIASTGDNASIQR